MGVMVLVCALALVVLRASRPEYGVVVVRTDHHVDHHHHPDARSQDDGDGDDDDVVAPPPGLVDAEKEDAPPPLQSDADSLQKHEPALRCPTRLRFLPRATKNVTLLASYPGSGNTWVRHLIQRGTGVHTGATYNDTALAGEFAGEGRKDGSVIVVKTHYPCGGCWSVPPALVEPVPESDTGRRSYRMSSGAIVVVRNPFGAILSEFNRIGSGLNHTGVVDPARFDSPDFAEFVRRRVISWRRHTTFYLRKRVSSTSPLWRDENGNVVLVVVYESLKRDTERALVPVFDFLKQRRSRELASLDPHRAAACAVHDVAGRFKRAKPDTTDPFARPFRSFPLLVRGVGGGGDAAAAATNPIREGETLREMVCRFLGKAVWRPHDWGDCLDPSTSPS